jgi:L-iditol 2-dehydrogenase
MKVAVLKKNGEIFLQERIKPLIESDSCLIKIKFCGICSTDIYRAHDNGAYNYPLVMGHEISGIIEDIGQNVKDFAVGNKVSVFPLLPCFKCNQCKENNYALCINYSYYGSRCDGGYAQYLIVKPWNLMKISDKIKLEDACFMEPTAVVIHAIRLMKVLKTNKKNILIIGAGFLGLLIAEIIFRNTTNKITILDRNDFKFSNLPPNTLTCTSENELIKDEYDYIFECTGNKNALNISLETIARNGSICVVGNPNDNMSISSRNYSKLLRKEALIKGSWNSFYKKPNKDDWTLSNKVMVDGLNPSKFVSHVINLDELDSFLLKCWNHKKRSKNFEHIKGLVKI